MNSNLDNDQLFNICAGLFKGFIEWIDVNSQNEKALILDSAYHFKNQILNQEHPTLQKKYFQTPQDLSSQETHILLNQWKDTFSNLINSDLDRVSKDSFKIWFLSLVCHSIPQLEEEGKILWTKLLEGVEYCKYFRISDVPYPLNTITKN